MADVKVLTFFQSGLDALFILMVVFSFFSDTFGYLINFKIGIVHLTYKYQNSEGLEAYVKARYQDFHYYFCERQEDLARVSELCFNYSNFRSSGLVFIIMSSFALALAIYGQCFLIGRMMKSKKQFFQFQYAHLVYPLVYSIGFISYCVISHITLLEPSGQNCVEKGCEIQLGIGFFFMFGAEIIALVSFFMFLVTRKKINSILYPPEIHK